MTESLLSTPELAAAAKRVRLASDLTIRAAAAALGVTATSVHRAESARWASRYVLLQARMVAVLGEAEVEGPLWRVRTSNPLLLSPAP